MNTVLDEPGRSLPNSMDGFWMPFTANRAFKANPKLLIGADGMYYTTHDGRQLLDGTAGLWCCPAGHNHPRIVEAIQRQAATLDYAPHFQLAHPAAFDLSARLLDLAGDGYSQVFYCNSGSEAVDTALKIALAYHRGRGDASRTRLIGRERGYHGVGFGGISVGGISPNRKVFGAMLPGVDHMRHTLDIERNAFTRGETANGIELAEDLERIVALHDASTIAAVIVEPVACSTGVIPPPVGYLKRLREICDKHGILLIFDEVITGFGRLGTNFAVDWFGVKPDLVTMAKGMTNGCVPMGGVVSRGGIFDAISDAAPTGIELFHGYTYSAHPLAVAAALGALQAYREDALFERAAELSPYFEDALHSLKDARHVIDIRNLGLIGGIELEPRPTAPGARAMEAFTAAYEEGVLIRVTGDIIALSPPFIVDRPQIDRMIETVREVLAALD